MPKAVSQDAMASVLGLDGEVVPFRAAQSEFLACAGCTFEGSLLKCEGFDTHSFHATYKYYKQDIWVDLGVAIEFGFATITW